MDYLKCLILDDDITSINRLKGLLKKIDYVNLIGTSTQPLFVVDDVIEKRPEIVFLEIEMNGKDGFEIIDEVKMKGYNPAFVFVTETQQYVIKAIKCAIFDYLLKPIDFKELKACLIRYRTLNPTNKNINIQNSLVCGPLSDREKEVLSFVIKGLTSQEISKKLSLSVSTINFHRQNILFKTESKNFSQLIFKMSESENKPIQYRLN